MKAMLEQLSQGASPDINALIDALGETLPLLNAFANTPQEPQWHSEGDVRVHTRMVLEELYQSFAEEKTPIEQRRALILAALLHDVGKPLCTRAMEIHGVNRLTALHHEARGRSYLALKLVDQGLDFEELQTVLGCVGSHHLPKKLVKQEATAGVYRRCARNVPMAALYSVEQADMRGRICADREKQVEMVELFRLFSEEAVPDGFFEMGKQLFREAMVGAPAAALDRAYGEAVRALESGKIQSFEEGLFLAHQTLKNPPELVVLVGPSGSGKSTFAQSVLADHILISLDEIRKALSGDRLDQSVTGQARQEAKKRLKAALRPGKKVVWDATSLKAEFRKAVVEEGYAYGALVTLVVFQQQEAEIFRRNQSREEPVPESVLEKQLGSLEWPEAEEAHRVVWLDGEGQVRGLDGFCGDVPWGLRSP
jgi:predicted kinase